VVAGLYPAAFLAARIGGGAVDVRNVTPPGVEPHDLDLAPADAAAIEQARLVVYFGSGLQPAVADAAAQSQGLALDLLAGEAGTDPHVWLDPVRFARLGEKVASVLAVLDPDRADVFAGKAADLEAELLALDAEFAAALAQCSITAVVVSHAAFGPMLARYGLEQIAISGLSPDEEPAPADLEEAAARAAAAGATTIYFETLVPRDLSEALAAEIGAVTAVLNPVEGLTGAELAAGGDYFTVMRENLAALVAGQEC